jgi:predicted nucleic acid-binding protein
VHPQIDILDRAFELGNSSGLTVYVALYLALVERLKGSLITLDVRQANVARQLAIEIIEP